MIAMTRVWSRLWLGCIDDAEHLGKSNPHRISTVLSLTREPLHARAERVNYLQIPIRDGSRIPVAQCDAIVDALFENIRWGTVLVHCLGGVSRSPVIAGAWMHIVGYSNIDQALAEISRIRPIDPSPVLLNSVKELL